MSFLVASIAAIVHNIPLFSPTGGASSRSLTETDGCTAGSKTRQLVAAAGVDCSARCRC